MVDIEVIKNMVRENQKKAIEVLEGYIKSTSEKQAMINMPTGTGKTGIMAILSLQFSDNILIVVPNSVLPNQIKREINKKFWDKIGVTKPSSLKEINVIDSLSKINAIDSSKKYIWIITIQWLTEIKKNKEKEFNKIKDLTKLILFDEGHRELATTWSNTIEQFSCKKILFTATPYRNDNQAFQIDDLYKHTYPIEQAINDHAICSPTFKVISKECKKDISKISTFVINLLSDSKKILIRMQSSNEISNLVSSINKLSPDIAVGFHSDFVLKSSDVLLSEGKKILTIKDKYSVFIHSDMLIEGLDFCDLDTLIIVDSFGNAKSFIQQVGRILRLAPTKRDAFIYIYEDELAIWQNQWKLYNELNNSDKRILYISGFFKNNFELEGKIINKLLIPFTANIFTSADPVYQPIVDSLKNRYMVRKDIEHVIYNEDTGTDYNIWIACYKKIQASKYLATEYYLNNTIEVCVVLELLYDTTYYVYYLDTGGSGFDNIISGLKQLPPDKFYKLAPENFHFRNTKFTQSMQKKVGPQKRDITGFELNKLPANISEKMSFCNNVSGVVEQDKKIYRYISPITAKITDKQFGIYSEYIKWCQKITKTINKRSDGNKYFNRYSKIVSSPSTKPTSIILELDKNIKVEKSSKSSFLESQYLEVNTSDEFCIKIQTKLYKGKIEDIGTNNISLNINSKIFIEDDKVGYISLNRYINKNKFRLYYAKDDVVYYDGIYLKPNIKTVFSDINEWSLWRNIISLGELKNCQDEKEGDQSTLINWPPESVFRVVIDNIKSFGSNIDYLVCDDLDKEIADFIALSTNENKIYFIHCKQHKKQLSASDFQDVFGQAIKNMHYILETDWSNLSNIEKHINRWKGNWKHSSKIKKRNEVTAKAIGVPETPIEWSLKRLVIAPTVSGAKANVEDFVEAFKKIVTSLDGKKEVCVIQSGLSKEALKEQMILRPSFKQKEQVTQLVWYMQNVQDIVLNAGGNLTIYCQP